jgi:hypothetical protein
VCRRRPFSCGGSRPSDPTQALNINFVANTSIRILIESSLLTLVRGLQCWWDHSATARFSVSFLVDHNASLALAFRAAIRESPSSSRPDTP